MQTPGPVLWSEARCETLPETRALAIRFAECLRSEPVDFEDGLVLTLSGEMGAGKTHFAQAFIQSWAQDPELYVPSPTYAIAHLYETDPPIAHLDLFRIGSLDELEAIGYRDLYFSNSVALIEWADRIPEALPKSRIEIQITVTPSEARIIRARLHGDRLGSLLSRIFK